MLSILKMIFGGAAPTHYAQPYWPTHDETLNLVEARRGRGKSYGAVFIMLEWIRERYNNLSQFSKIITNIEINERAFALLLCKEGIINSFVESLKFVRTRIVVSRIWDDYLTAYDSLIIMDEANRNLNNYNNGKEAQQFMLVCHDWLQQTRKHRLTLYFLTQDISWMKGQVLSLADRLWRAKRVRKSKNSQEVKTFPWYGSDPYSKGRENLNRNADFKMRFPFKMEIARCYDTRQAVATIPLTSQFSTFEEISNYMIENSLKPLPLPTISDLDYYEMEALYNSIDSSPVCVSSVPPLGGAGGARAGGIFRRLSRVFFGRHVR